MNALSHTGYLDRLQQIGVRTDKKIEVMYCDLFRVTENMFLKECHATEAFELYDFVTEKVKFRELHELRRHLEELLIWMYPKGLPIWPKGTNRRFKELTNPYLTVGFEPINKKTLSTKSSQWISAAFNLRCGKPGEQLRKDREILLQKLEDRHFAAGSLEEYRTTGGNNSVIPRIGLNLMKQEIYLLGPEESFLPDKPNEESLSKGWQKKYTGIFDRFSDTGLTIYFNKRVDYDNSVPAWQGILSALKDQLIKRNIDFTSIGGEHHLEIQQCVVLVDKKMQTIKELPKEIVEGMLMMLQKKKGIKKMKVNIAEIDEKDMFYWEKGCKCSVNINFMLQSFYNDLLEQG